MCETKRKEIPASVLLPFPIKHVVYQKLPLHIYLQEYGKNTELSPAGNWTPVSRVTGGDTHHYTTEEWLFNTN